jgi:hypothetical protein
LDIRFCWLAGSGNRSPPPAAFPDQPGDLSPRRELFAGSLRTVEIGCDLVARLRLQLEHAGPQQADLAPYFINSVVHVLLEQNKNI